MKLATIALGALLLGGAAACAEPSGLRGTARHLEGQGWREMGFYHDDGRIRIEAERGGEARRWLYHPIDGRLVLVGDDDDRWRVRSHRWDERGRGWWVRGDDDDDWDDD